MSATGTAKQHWSARRYAETARFVAELGAPVLELLAACAGERILDLGCGDGALTEKIAAAGAVVVAVDAAPDMVAAARARGIDARIISGESLTFNREFDAVFSNAALHWMHPPDAVLAGVRRALKPRGRFVGEMGGHNNTAAIIVALSAVLGRRGLDAHRLSPWYFPSVAAYRAKLEGAGFAVADIDVIPRPTALPGSIEPWLDTFGEAFLGALPEADRSSARAEVADLLAPGVGGRNRNLDCRLRPPPLPGDAHRLSGVGYGSILSRSISIAAAFASALRFDEAVAVVGSAPTTLARTVKSGA